MQACLRGSRHRTTRAALAHEAPNFEWQVTSSSTASCGSFDKRIIRRRSLYPSKDILLDEIGMKRNAIQLSIIFAVVRKKTDRTNTCFAQVGAAYSNPVDPLGYMGSKAAKPLLPCDTESSFTVAGRQWGGACALTCQPLKPCYPGATGTLLQGSRV